MLAVPAPPSEKQSEHKVEQHSKHHVINAKHHRTIVANVWLQTGRNILIYYINNYGSETDPQGQACNNKQ